MSPELDQKLCTDYPEIFELVTKPASPPRMPIQLFHFECSDGWYPLIDQLCKALTADARALARDIENMEAQLMVTDRSNWHPWQLSHYTEENLQGKRSELSVALEQIPRAVQVKEKYAGLRFYVQGATEKQYQLIEFAETLSYRICECCGSMKDTRVYRLGWWRTLCPEHASAQYGAGELADYLEEVSC